MEKRAIILSGGWEGHTPLETSRLFSDLLVAEGFEVRVESDLERFVATELSSYSLIVPMWTMAEHATVNGRVAAAIAAAVAAGTGLAGCHGGMGDALRGETAYLFVTGAQWVAHPGDETVSFEVRFVDGDDPLVAGLEPFRMVTEQYYLHLDPCVRVLAYSEFPNAPGDYAVNGPVRMPVVYTKLYGKGRVYYCSLGHTWRDFDRPEARELMRRGLLWAAGADGFGVATR